MEENKEQIIEEVKKETEQIEQETKKERNLFAEFLNRHTSEPDEKGDRKFVLFNALEELFNRQLAQTQAIIKLNEAMQYLANEYEKLTPKSTIVMPGDKEFKKPEDIS